MVAYILVYCISSFLIACLGKTKWCGFLRALLASLFLTPVVGFIVVLCSESAGTSGVPVSALQNLHEQEATGPRKPVAFMQLSKVDPQHYYLGFAKES